MDYRITVPGRRIVGDACFYFMELQDIEEMGLNKPFKFFSNLGLQPTDIFVGLSQFYPNGRGPVRQYMRKGVGAFVFDRILQDCKRRNGNVLYICTRAPTMEAFAKKKGFTHGDIGVSSYGKEYCLLLNPQCEQT